MCFGCSKDPSHRDGSFEYPQHMFWLRNKKIIFWYRLLSGGLLIHCSVTCRLNSLKIVTVFQLEQCQADLTSERNVSQKLENTRLQLERQNKEMKDKLNELEGQIRTRTKATIAALEGKVANLEEQLDMETK